MTKNSATVRAIHFRQAGRASVYFHSEHPFFIPSSKYFIAQLVPKTSQRLRNGPGHLQRRSRTICALSCRIVANLAGSVNVAQPLRNTGMARRRCASKKSTDRFFDLSRDPEYSLEVTIPESHRSVGLLVKHRPRVSFDRKGIAFQLHSNLESAPHDTIRTQRTRVGIWGRPHVEEILSKIVFVEKPPVLSLYERNGGRHATEHSIHGSKSTPSSMTSGANFFFISAHRPKPNCHTGKLRVDLPSAVPILTNLVGFVGSGCSSG